jgi:hypothetical protein
MMICANSAAPHHAEGLVNLVNPQKNVTDFRYPAEHVDSENIKLKKVPGAKVRVILVGHKTP